MLHLMEHNRVVWVGGWLLVNIRTVYCHQFGFGDHIVIVTTMENQSALYRIDISASTPNAEIACAMRISH